MLGAAQRESGSSTHFLTVPPSLPCRDGVGGRVGNLQCHLFKENKKEKWPAYWLSCWLRFSSSLLCFQAHESLGREENKGAESTKPQQKFSIWFSDFKPSKVRLQYCIAPWRGIRQSEVVYLEEPYVYRNDDHFIRVLVHFLFRNPSQYRAGLDALIKPHFLSSLYPAHYLGLK